MAKQINARIITKHDSATNWAKAINFVPKEGELIVYEPEPVNGGVSSVARLKVGDGVNKINNLKFITAPYVEKQNGYGLSKNDFTDNYKNLLDEFLQIDDIKFTDTTYTAIEGGGLFFQKNPDDNFKYNCFNTGLLSVEYKDTEGALIFGKYNIQEGSNSQSINLKEIITTNLSLNLNNFISTGQTAGTLSVNGEDVPVNGLGELAYLNRSYINDQIVNATGEKEVFIGDPEESNGEKLQIDIKNNNPILKYRIPNTNQYKIYPFLQIEYNWETPWQIGFHTEKEDYNINTGIFGNGVDIPDGANLNDYINIGIYSSYDSISSSLLNTPITTTGFKLIVLNGYENFIKHQLILSFDNSIYYRVLQENNWTEWINLAIPDNFLPLTGGTVTGPTIFSNTTQSTSTTTGAVKITGGLGVGKNIYGSKVFGAVWNDYAEYRSVNIETPGFCVADTNDGIMKITNKRLMPCCKIITDTYGFAIGKTEEAKVPIAISGRVLAHTFESKESFEIGDCVCSGPNGLVSKMTREEIINYPDRIVGIVSEIPNYSEWGENNIAVNNRIWIYVR